MYIEPPGSQTDTSRLSPLCLQKDAHTAALIYSPLGPGSTYRYSLGRRWVLPDLHRGSFAERD